MDDEGQLLQQWRRGDAGAARELYERHNEAVHRFFYNKVGTHVGDLVQRTFAACFEAAEHYGGDSRFRTFLLGIARQKLLSWYGTRAGSSRNAAEVTAESLGLAPVASAERDPERRVLLRGLRMLPVETQIVVELFYWEELEVGELAVLYGASHDDIDRYLQEARQTLRGTISQVLAENPFGSNVERIEACLESMRRSGPVPRYELGS